MTGTFFIDVVDHRIHLNVMGTTGSRSAENRDTFTKRTTTGGVLIGSDYDLARTRKITAEAEIAELELAKIRKDLCLTSDVVKAWSDVLHAARAKFLAMPTKIAPVVATQSEIAVIERLIDDQVREALAELSNYQPHIDPSQSAGSSDEAEPDQDAKPAAPKRGRGRPKKTANL